MIPRELQATPQWLVSGNNKVPISPRTGTAADVRNRDLYVTYEEAVAYAKERSFDVGFVLTPEDPFTAIDLDSADATAEQQARHQKIFEAFPTYAELSRSGKGVHIWCYGKVPRGVRRDRVEVYSDHRYMISTGRALKEVPIADCQSLLDVLFEEMARVGEQGQIDLEEIEELIPDADLFEMATRAANAEKFEQLCRGEWQEDYPSQSEADYALMNMLCFYTRSNSQAKRLFRYSALGRRDKAQREAYLDTMIRKIRAEELPLIDFSHVGNGNGTSNGAGAGGNHAPPVAVKEGGVGAQGSGVAGGGVEQAVGMPPGLVGEVAEFLYQWSPRPIREVALISSIGFFAGMLGRQFNMDKDGLNLYLVLLAESGTGKSFVQKGINYLFAEMARGGCPAASETFMGPRHFASGQGLIKEFGDRPCFVSVLNEFGIMLKELTDQRAIHASKITRQAILDLYTSSGRDDILRPSVYSDKQKNTAPVAAPALTLVGETVPGKFFEAVTGRDVSEGLLPRFLVLHYTGEVPDLNRNRQSLPEDLRKRIESVAVRTLQMMSNSAWCQIQLSPEAEQLLVNFEKTCTRTVRGMAGTARVLWTRAYTKVQRLSGLLAAADNVDMPTVSEEMVRWAIRLVTYEVNAMVQRLEDGHVGSNESAQIAETRRIIKEYAGSDYNALGATYKKYITYQMFLDGVVPLAYVQSRAYQIGAFTDSGRPVRMLVKDALDHLSEIGMVQEIPVDQVKARYACRRQLFKINA